MNAIVRILLLVFNIIIIACIFVTERGEKKGGESPFLGVVFFISGFGGCHCRATSPVEGNEHRPPPKKRLKAGSELQVQCMRSSNIVL